MIRFSAEVAMARSEKRPVVVLESTIISHGLPRPRNMEVAREVEEIVRSQGAIPATIAIIDGRIHVGLEPDLLIRIANDDAVVKASIRDLPIVTAKGLSAATTPSTTNTTKPWSCRGSGPLSKLNANREAKKIVIQSIQELLQK